MQVEDLKALLACQPEDPLDAPRIALILEGYRRLETKLSDEELATRATKLQSKIGQTKYYLGIRQENYMEIIGAWTDELEALAPTISHLEEALPSGAIHWFVKN